MFATTQVVYVPPPPTFWEWVKAVFDHPKYIFPMAVYYWPWTVGIAIALVLYYDLYLEDRIKGETPKIIRLMQPSPPAAATTKTVEAPTQENYEKLEQYVKFFVGQMAKKGNPGSGPISLERVKMGRMHANHWNYGPVNFSTNVADGGWQQKVYVSETGDWNASEWSEVILTPTGDWAIFGSYDRWVFARGEDHEISAETIVQRTSGSRTATIAICGAIEQAISALLQQYNPSALPEFNALRSAG